MNRTWISLVAIAGFQFSATAATTVPAEQTKSENKIKIEQVNPNANKAPGEDVDDTLTNKKMRAESGSKSKLSISNAINYQGSTLEKPLNENRPNITAGTDVTAFAALTDQLSAKYAITQKKAILAGIGIRWITPLQGNDTPTGYNGDKLDASNPYVKYQYIYKFSGIQNVMTVGPQLTTQADSRRNGVQGNLLFQQNSVYDIGHSGLSIGLTQSVTATRFDKSDSQLLASQSDYGIGFYPFLEYTINDRLNLRTISGVWVYEHVRSESRADTFNKNVIYESVGLGISVSRDFFLYPNIQFIPEDIRADRTNVGLQMAINVF